MKESEITQMTCRTSAFVYVMFADNKSNLCTYWNSIFSNKDPNLCYVIYFLLSNCSIVHVLSVNA